MRKLRFCLWASLFVFCMPLLVAGAVHAAERYRVKAGDSLYKIAKKYHVSADAIRDANGLTGDALKLNQALVIPAGKALKKPAESTVKKKTAGMHRCTSSRKARHWRGWRK
mgnify:CR=1 FL=1